MSNIDLNEIEVKKTELKKKLEDEFPGCFELREHWNNKSQIKIIKNDYWLGFEDLLKLQSFVSKYNSILTFDQLAKDLFLIPETQKEMAEK